MIPKFISARQEHQALIVYGDGNQTRDFVYVADVARALLKAMESTENGIFNIGTSSAISVLCLAKKVIALVESTAGYTFADPRPGDAVSSTADIGLTATKLGWSPAWDLDAGLRETARWFNSKRSGATV